MNKIIFILSFFFYLQSGFAMHCESKDQKINISSSAFNHAASAEMIFVPQPYSAISMTMISPAGSRIIVFMNLTDGASALGLHQTLSWKSHAWHPTWNLHYFGFNQEKELLLVNMVIDRSCSSIGNCSYFGNGDIEVVSRNAQNQLSLTSISCKYN